MFIYVVEPYDNYNKIRFDINIKNTNSEYDIVPRGYVRTTSSDEYKKTYKSLYESDKEYAVVIRDNGISATGDHLTAMVPIKNSKGSVEGILCVQWQMADLDTEKIFFLKHTSATMLIYLVLMLFIGGKYLNSKLLNPLGELTQGAKKFLRAISKKSFI